MHEELQTKRAVTEQLSRDLEDPANLIRFCEKGQTPSIDGGRFASAVRVNSTRETDLSEA